NNDGAIAHIDVHPLRDQYIKSVGLIKPRTDRFIDNAQYVLVIATDKAIYIFGFSSSSQGVIFHDMSSDRYRTDYSKKDIGPIIGTEDGRIFLIDAGELCELVYEASAIELLLKAAQSFDPVPEKRNSILDLVIDTLRDAGVFVDGIQRNTQSYNPVLQKALNLGTSLNDKTFLYAVYDEFLRADSIPQLFDPPAPHLEDYLNSSNDLKSPIARKKMDLFCDFCVTHHQYLKAAMVKEHIAKNSGSDVGLQERLHYLSHAVGQAESAKEICETKDVIEALHRLRNELKVARIQFEICSEIDNMSDAKYRSIAISTGKPDKSQLLALLNQQLFDADILLRDFAMPFDLVEKELSIVHAVELKLIFVHLQASQRAKESGTLQPMTDVILECGRRFYPHDLRVFPMETIVRLIAIYLIDNRVNEPNFIVEVLKKANVAFGDLFNTLHHLYALKIDPFNSKEGMYLLLKELVYLLNQWMKSVDERYLTFSFILI
ncbi:7099_t:CDS:10, partial [Acaulospora colombiana]